MAAVMNRLARRERDLLVRAGRQVDGAGERITFSVSDEDQRSVRSLVDKGLFELYSECHFLGGGGGVYSMTLTHEGWARYQAIKKAASRRSSRRCHH